MSSEQCVICGHDESSRLFVPLPADRQRDAMSDVVPSSSGPGAGPGDQSGHWVTICDRCGHGERAGRRTFEENIAFQEDFYRTEPAPPRVRRWPGRPALLAARIRCMLGESGSMLDIGCGPGTWLAHFGPGWQKFGVDVSRKAADVARRTTGAHVFCGPVEDYRDAPRDLDLITAFALIEHLQDPRMLIAWASDHLRPGGLLVLMTGDRESGQARAMGPAWPMYVPDEHVHFFSARSLTRLVEAHHLAVVRKEWRPMVYALPPTSSAPSALRVRRLATRLGLRAERYLAKAKEIAGLLQDGYYDHLYVYARRMA